jgi:hypothetical protein
MSFFKPLSCNAFNYLILWMVLSNIGMLTITGCGSTGSSSTGSAAKSAVVLIGQPDNALADKLSANFHLTTMGTEPNAPVLVYLVDDGEYYDDEIITYINKAFEAGYPVALLNPNSNDIEVFNDTIGFDFDKYFSTRNGIAIYGIDKNNIGKKSALLINATPPSALIPVTTDLYEDGKLVQTTSEQITFSSTEEDEQETVALLREWINEDQGRNTVVDLAATAKAQNQMLQKVAEAVGTKQINLNTIGELTVDLAGSYRLSTSGNPNSYSIRNKIWRIYDQERNDDYILIDQSAILSAAGQIIADSLSRRAYYALSYQISTQLVDFDDKPIKILDGDGNPVSLLERTSIATFQGSTTYTNSFNWSLNGKLSGKVSDKAGGEIGGEVGGSVSYTKSSSYQIPDVTLDNRSDPDNGIASALHTIARPTPDTFFLRTDFKDIKTIAKSTYTPSNQILFKIPDTAFNGNERLRDKFPSGVYLRTALKIQLGESVETVLHKFAGSKQITYDMPVISSKQMISWPLYYPSDDVANIKADSTIMAGDYKWQDMSNKDMHGVIFDSTDLTGSLFASADLTAATFKSATLIETSFYKAILNNATFNSAKFYNTTFQYAKLVSVNLRNADLKKVNFTGADLSGADLYGAKIDSTVNFSNTKLNKTIWYDGTKCPDTAGKVRQVNGKLVCVK